MKSKPKDLVVELPILRIIPIETCHLRLQVWIKLSTHLCTLYGLDIFFLVSVISLCFGPQNTMRTPVYTTSMRRNAMGVGLVFEADLSTTLHLSHWVLQGVCLCLNTD